MTYIQTELFSDYEPIDQGSGVWVGGCEEGQEVSVRMCCPQIEEGYQDVSAEPLSWLNSARITADPEEDAVHCVVSVGDPRGGFRFTVRRLSDGQMVIHTPYPGEGMAHVATRQLHEGTLILVHDGEDAAPVVFSMDEPEEADA